MATVSTPPSRDQPDLPHTQPSSPSAPAADERHGVVKAALLATCSFLTAIGAIVGLAGDGGVQEETVRYALTVACIIAALALGIAAVYVWPRK